MDNEYSLRIKCLIEESGKSYQELEKATGIAKSSLQRYASGTTSKIPLEVVDKIAKALDVSPAYIMGWDVEDKDKPTEDDGLSENRKALIEFAKSVPEEKAAMILRVMKSILEGE